MAAATTAKAGVRTGGLSEAELIRRAAAIRSEAAETCVLSLYGWLRWLLASGHREMYERYLAECRAASKTPLSSEDFGLVLLTQFNVLQNRLIGGAR